MNKDDQNIKDFLWEYRGNLRCYYCDQKAVISGHFCDSLGYTWNYECIHCNKPQNNSSLAYYNGYTPTWKPWFKR